LDYRRPEAYEPGRSECDTDLELEAPTAFQERKRFGSADVRWTALARDSYRCRLCGAAVTSDRAYVDHIRPVKCFASFREAHTLDNVQTLCVGCHRAKTRRERMA
jgi:5-methylcytosine-specific restriction endonuclease McrA